MYASQSPHHGVFDCSCIAYGVGACLVCYVSNSADVADIAQLQLPSSNAHNQQNFVKFDAS